MKRPRSIMVDIETKSTSKRAFVLSVGAVAFDDYGFLSEYDKTHPNVFYGQVQWDDPTQSGRDVDNDTLDWWSKQKAYSVLRSPDMQQQQYIYTQGLPDLLKELADFIKQEKTYDGRMIARGIDFDFAILDSAYRDFRLEVPWKYNHTRCMRGWLDACFAVGLSSHLHQGIKDEGLKHHAADDAIYQTKVFVRYNHELWKIRNKSSQAGLDLGAAPMLQSAP